MGEGLQAIAVIGIGVEPELHKAQCGRTFRQELATPDRRFLVQVLARHRLVDEPHSDGVLSTILVTQIPDLTCLFLAHDTCEVHGAKASVKTPYLGAGLAENSAI